MKRKMNFKEPTDIPSFKSKAIYPIDTKETL